MPNNALNLNDLFRMTPSLSRARSCVLAMLFASWVAFLSIPATVYGQTPEVVKKVIFTEWLEQSTLKYGLLVTFCSAQALTGLVESAKYNGHYIVSSDGDTYHAYRYGQDIALIGTGWMTYANIRDAHLSWFGKMRRILGSAMIARNVYEWAYKANRYGNPFDYEPEHNRKALVYFGFQDGHFTDLYIGTGKTSGPLVDMGFLLLGMWIFE